jgi:predicted deacylase
MAPGEHWRGHWESSVSQTPSLPALAARGKADGPILLVMGGVHGDEYEGPAAIARLFQELEAGRSEREAATDRGGAPGLQCGLLLGLPVVQTAARAAHCRVGPVDGVDLNRAFPGSREADGRPTPALAHAVFETFVRRCDALIDLHSGGAALVHLPLAGWYADSREAERLARGFGPAFHPWRLPDVPGVLSAEAHRAGKVAIGAEWGGGARLDPAGVAAFTQALRRALVALEMRPPEGEVDEPSLDPRPSIAGDYQTTPLGGLFSPAVQLGDRVTAGALLGVIQDDWGEVTAEIRAARGGMVAGLPHRPLLRAGDRVAYVG